MAFAQGFAADEILKAAGIDTQKKSNVFNPIQVEPSDEL